MIETNPTELALSNGFRVAVTPLPPYYIDWIDDLYSLPKPPMRKLTLTAGDVVEYDYIVPNEPPDESHVEDYGLYLQYREYLRNLEIIGMKRERAKRDFLFSMCVEVLSGPVSIDDPKWVYMLEAPFDTYEVPSHPGKKMLAFMKAVVLHSIPDYQAVIKIALYQEVNMQSILDALSSFQPSMAGQKVRAGVEG